MRVRFKGTIVEIRADRVSDRAFQGAAYLLSQSAYVLLGTSGRARVVSLRPKRPETGLPSLARAFQEEYASQTLRWRLLDIQKAAVLRGLASALRETAGTSAEGGGPSPVLPPWRLEEIDALLREAESSPRDPLKISTPWSERRPPMVKGGRTPAPATPGAGRRRSP